MWCCLGSNCCFAGWVWIGLVGGSLSSPALPAFVFVSSRTDLTACLLLCAPQAKKMPWQSAPPLAIITVAMGGVSGLMSLTNYLTVGRTDRLIGLDDFDYM